MRIVFALCVLTGTAAAALAAEQTITLKDGAGRQTAEAMCSGCHSLDYIRLNATFMSRQNWTAEVTKMIQTFGAPISQADAATIIGYLSANYGTPEK